MAVAANFVHLRFVAATDQRDVHVRQRRGRIDQLLPTFPVAHADLRDEEAIIGDGLLAPERARIPLRGIEAVDVGAGVDDDDLLRRQAAALDDDAADLFADGDDAIDAARAELGAIPAVERKRHAAIGHERAGGLRQRGHERQRVRDALVHVHDVGAAQQAPQPARADHVERVAHRQRLEAHAVLRGFGRERGTGTADDRHVVPALAQPGGGLKHLMHRAGVELIELEDLENAHGVSSLAAKPALSEAEGTAKDHVHCARCAT